MRLRKNNNYNRKAITMKISRKEANCKAHARPILRFESHQLTAFGGIVILQELFASLQLVEQLRGVFHRRQLGKIYRPQKLFLQLVLHLLLGFRSLRDVLCYQSDPLVQRVLGMQCVANSSTLSRMLRDMTDGEIQALRRLMSQQVLDRLCTLTPARITLDFDGSVCSTKRHAQGTAVGFNKKKKGERSYYPLFCTVAQTGQVLDLLHRPGNVHDSNGAKAFILQCVDRVRCNSPGTILEIRMDSAFFSDEIVHALDQANVEFTISVPFERFPKLKQKIEARKRWKRCGPGCSSFEIDWKPDCWSKHFRFLIVRQELPEQRKGELQLDLFEPRDWRYDYKVIITNKRVKVRSVTRYHEGRGSQEGIFAELKTHVAMGHIPVKTLNGNRAYLLAGLLAHNMIRELQMREAPPERRTNMTRAAHWVFEQVSTLRKQVFNRAGKLTKPSGQLTLTINAPETNEKQIRSLRKAANHVAA